MREILFTGKSKKTGKWVEGDLFNDKEGKLVKISYFDNRGFYCEEEVEPETVGQFAGITDKFGEKIFDGYILKITGVTGEESNEIIKSVEFQDGAFWVRLNVAEKRLLIWYINHCVVEVIGNVTDNPRLVGRGRKQ